MIKLYIVDVKEKEGNGFTAKPLRTQRNEYRKQKKITFRRIYELKNYEQLAVCNWQKTKKGMRGFERWGIVVNSPNIKP